MPAHTGHRTSPSGGLLNQAIRAAACVVLLLCAASGPAVSQEAPHPAVQEAQPKLMVQLGHSDRVRSVSLSPDGRWLLTGGDENDRSARLWDARSSLELRSFVHERAVSAVAFTPDGGRFVTADAKGTIRLWSLETLSEIRRFQNAHGPVWSISLAGRKMLTGHNVRVAVLWDVDSGEELRTFVSDMSSSVSAALSQDGRLVATGTSGGNGFQGSPATLWDAGTGRVLQQFGQENEANEVAFSPDGRFILATGCGSVTRCRSGYEGRVWDIAARAQAIEFSGRSDGSRGVAFSPDGRWLLAGGTLRNATTGQKIRDLPGLSSAVAYSRDGHFAVAAGNHVTLGEAGNTSPLQRFQGDASALTGAVFSSDDRRLYVGTDNGQVQTWDLVKGTASEWIDAAESPSTVLFSDDGTRALRYRQPDRSYEVWELGTRDRVAQFPGGQQDEFVFSPDGRRVAISAPFVHFARIVDARQGELKRIPGASDVLPHAFSPDGSKLVTSSSGPNGVSGGALALWNVDSNNAPTQQLEGPTGWIRAATFSHDGAKILTGTVDGTATLWDAATGRKLSRVQHPPWITAVALSPSGDMMLTGGMDGSARVWDTKAGTWRPLGGHAGSLASVAFSHRGDRIVTAGKDGTTIVSDAATAERLLTLVNLPSGGWVGTTPDGRFDTNDLEEIKGLHWIMGDDPLRALPVEIFMRDYFEPRLLPKVLGGEKLAQLRPLGSLNRVQPRVDVVSVEPQRSLSGAGGGEVDTVRVTVEVSGGSQDYGMGSRRRRMLTDAYDLRLFRDGRLVGQWPEPGKGTDGRQEIDEWRKASRVPMELGHVTARHTFRVALPRRDPGKPVVFTAYAFNEDRVKSATARNDKFKVQGEAPRRKPRAYVVTVGVDTYDNPRRNLDFAAKDARDMATALSSIKDFEVVRVTLVSGKAGPGGAEVRQGTKANIRAVLDLLAGKSEGERARLKRLPGIDRNAVDGLTKATPDDLVIIAFSGHGYTEASGRFHLLPSDSGVEAEITPAVLAKFISSEDLSQWLRDVDAGQMAMIIDACHSAAVVDTPGFKPGPMGDRGLGQLAYDKGMMILAATQVSDVALEVRKIQQGLLTYALVQDGLEYEAPGSTRRADFDRNRWVSLKEWLQYGAQRVPSLYEDIRSGKLAVIRRDSTPADAGWRDALARSAQTPSLFDFQRAPFPVDLAP
jgi:WD40 repeat protein